MTDDEKLAHYKEEIAKIRRKKKAEREKERRAHAKENRKIINDLLDKQSIFLAHKKGKKNDLSDLES